MRLTVQVLGLAADYYLRVSKLGLILLAVLCATGLIAVGFAAHRLLRDRFQDYERGGLTWAGYGVLAVILIGIVVALAISVEQETPSQAAQQFGSELPSGTDNPFEVVEEQNPFLR